MDLDGAASLTANVTINLLETKFGERVIGAVGWPLRSCDLTPLDYFLWGYVKSMVYGNKPAPIDELRTNIKREIANRPIYSRKSSKIGRLDFCKPARGGYAKEIDFHRGIECCFTGIKNFIDIENRFCIV